MPSGDALADSAVAGHDSLREVTRDDVKSLIFDPTTPLTHRTHLLKALRSLFRRLKRDQLIFRNPTTHLKLQQPDRLVNAALLPDQELRRAFQWAASQPQRRILVAFAAAQALRPVQMRRLLLHDVDLGERVIAINGDPRPLHELTYQASLHTSTTAAGAGPTPQPAPAADQQTAAELGPVSTTWTKQVMRPLGITLPQLRHDRLLDELLAAGPDPLHFQAVFGCGRSMALNHVEAAKRLLANDSRFQPLSSLNAYDELRGQPAGNLLVTRSVVRSSR
jgi:integrase